MALQKKDLNHTTLSGYHSKSMEGGGFQSDQFLKPPKSQVRSHDIHNLPDPATARPGRSVHYWSSDASKLNSRVAKLSGTSSVHPPCRPLLQETVRKWERAARETSYICNRCVTKLQDEIQENVGILQKELSKGKGSQAAKKAVDDLKDLCAFNQNVSMCLGKSMQHMTDSLFITMSNFTLMRWDAYLAREPLILSGYATSVRQNLLQELVRSLLAKQAIERVHNPSSLGFYNCLFLVPKPNNTWRPILDLSALNWFRHVKTFKMETPESIRLSLQQGEWVTSLDFSDAYFHIPINQVSRKYLRFHLEGQTL